MFVSFLASLPLLRGTGEEGGLNLGVRAEHVVQPYYVTDEPALIDCSCTKVRDCFFSIGASLGCTWRAGRPTPAPTPPPEPKVMETGVIVRSKVTKGEVENRFFTTFRRKQCNPTFAPSDFRTVPTAAEVREMIRMNEGETESPEGERRDQDQIWKENSGSAFSDVSLVSEPREEGSSNSLASDISHSGNPTLRSPGGDFKEGQEPSRGWKGSKGSSRKEEEIRSHAAASSSRLPAGFGTGETEVDLVSPLLVAQRDTQTQASHPQGSDHRLYSPPSLLPSQRRYSLFVVTEEEPQMQPNNVFTTPGQNRSRLCCLGRGQ